MLITQCLYVDTWCCFLSTLFTMNETNVFILPQAHRCWKNKSTFKRRKTLPLFYYACITLPDHQRLSMMKKERPSLLLWRIFRYTYNVNAIIIFSSPVFRNIELFVSKWHNSLFCNTYIMFSNCYLLSDHTM